LHAVFAAQNQEFSLAAEQMERQQDGRLRSLAPGLREGEFRSNVFGEYNIGDDAWEIDSLLKKFGVDPTSWW
jgi:nitrogenase molybdenum-iron protein alpha/beta subunit